MASTAAEQALTKNTSSGSRGGRHRRGGGDSASGRGGRGRGRGRDDDNNNGDAAAAPGGGRGGRRPRGIGRGVGRGGEGIPQQTDGHVQNTLRVAPDAPPKADGEQTASDSDNAICFICADPVRYNAVPPCNHTTCHICSLRLRALYKSKMCAHCRTESEFVIFTKDTEKLYEEFKDAEIIAQNNALGIKYDDQAICDDATLLLRYNCPDPSCDRACLGWPDLHRHVKVEHGRSMCDLCTRHKKVFTHEHELFTAAELRRHEKHGDDAPGSDNQSGFRGHPECGFCNQRFYSGDELWEHCRDKHERCHICERNRRADVSPQYYMNYDTLEGHFRKKHFLCSDNECLEKKFVVFENEIDLKAHQLEAHPNGLSKTARRDARRIDMSNFEAQAPRNDRRGRGRGGRGGRGRQELDDVPVRTEQNMTRAEIAYHRTQQLAIQSAQSTTSRTFGGQLSEPSFGARPAPQPARPEAPPPRPPPGQVPGNIPAAQPSNTAAFPPLSATRPATSRAQNPPRPSQPAAPTQNSTEARQLRHAAVIERASNMLRNDATKMPLFRNYISKFRGEAISGDSLVDSLWSLFDVSAKELNTLINEVAELYEDENKKRDLLKAWNNWKAINEDYPPIAGASSQSASTSTTANRVLKLKSSTARSGRSAAASAWGTAASSSSSSSNPFPSLAQSNPNRVGKGAVSATPWVAPKASSSSSSAGVVAGSRKEDFPSLPPKKMPANWTPITPRDRWGSAPATNAWAPSPNAVAQEHEDEDTGAATNGRKKKGKQKQLLFHVGL
ncbi:hypothetical protein FN846DRAFT_776407 [Sphaerosporella brunnea]|uniref:RING-type E3 ubiquitin transferase n=1 Tax=Sphaerosporella brunnea TaxID=1250544 RepID=A0A5J5F1C5_9PEZI|nr:hypothetical protein FN846DRAFT_776407 [Sphaerosporella brunnea]